jgi:hypothetical protein
MHGARVALDDAKADMSATGRGTQKNLMQLFGSSSRRNADRVVIAEDGFLLHPCRLPASHKGIRY